MANKPPVYGGAKPLSREDWKKKRGSGPWKGNRDYQTYINFWNAHHPGVTGTTANPAANQSPPGMLTMAQIQQMANSYLPKAQTREEITKQTQSSVQAQIDPIIAQITKAIAGRSKQGTEAINAATDIYSTRMAGIAPQVTADFDQAKKEQAALDQALTGLAQGQGQAAYTDLAGALGQAGAPAGAIAASAGQLQGAGQGAAQMLGATGASTLSRLISQGAGAEAYSKDLPAFAQMQGSAGLAGFQNMLNTMLSDKTGEIQAQIPGLVSSLTESAITRGDTNAAARAGFVSDALSRNLSAWTAAQGLGLNYAQLAAGQASDFANLANPGGTGGTTGGWTNSDRAGAAGSIYNKAAALFNVEGYARWQTAGTANGVKHKKGEIKTDVFGQPIKATVPTINTKAYRQVYSFAAGMPIFKGVDKWKILDLVRQQLVAAGYEKAANAPAYLFFGTAPPKQKQPGYSSPGPK